MAVITPQSDVYLLKVPLEINDINQLTFSNVTAQFNYFNSLPKLTVDNFTYQRKDGTIRYGASFDDLIGFNYVMYRNEAYSNKWFYAFITGMEYLNDNVTAIAIKTDVFQTWQFDLTYKQCFVEREHVNDDTIGVNTIDEGLEVGEYIINSATTLMPSATVRDKLNNLITYKLPIVFQVSELAGGVGIASSVFDSSYNRVFSGLYYFAVTSYSAARNIIYRYDNAGKGDAIISIFLAPKEFLQGAEVYGDLGYNIYIPQDDGYASTLLSSSDGTITRPSKVDGYTPKNNKLFVYPYSYVYVSNNTGVDSEFRYEDFKNNTPKFYMGGALGQGCNVKLCPVDYKGHTGEVFDHGIVGAKYPICAWSSDYYTNWITQNAVNVNLGMVTGGIATGSQALTGNYVGTTQTLLSSIGGVMSQIHQAKVRPDQAKGNTNSSDLLVGWERYYTVDCMSVRSEIARSIDNFFSQFGYKVNRVKIPNITGRRNWNYVKTVGCYIEADIPQGDLQEIKEMFDKGITLWHNPNTFVDYSQNNDII